MKTIDYEDDGVLDVSISFNFFAFIRLLQKYEGLFITSLFEHYLRKHPTNLSSYLHLIALYRAFYKLLWDKYQKFLQPRG